MSQEEKTQAPLPVAEVTAAVENKKVELAQQASSFTMDQLYFWKNPQFKEYTNEFDNTILQPSSKVYSELPQQITDFKKQYLFNIDQNYRMIGTCLGGIFGFIVARKVTPGFIRSIRNTAFFTAGLGVFIAPEFFNPFIKFHECKECESEKKQ